MGCYLICHPQDFSNPVFNGSCKDTVVTEMEFSSPVPVNEIQNGYISDSYGMD